MRSDAITQPGYDPAVAAATLDVLLRRLRRRAPPWCVGLSGLQGSGKSTFANQLAGVARERGFVTEVLSLDDFYFGRRVRAALARDVHPLLATRGVPGTHEVDLLLRTLDDLATASARRPALVPRFDKGRDTRVAPSRWRRVSVRPRLILLEGWCVGVPPEGAAALRRPRNALEREEDADRRWRLHVNAQIENDYVRVWRRLDQLIVLQAPDFAIVSHWRDEQEHAVRRRGAPHALDAPALARFLMHYERISRHALRTLPGLADIALVLDRRRRVTRIVEHTATRLGIDD